MPRGINGNQNDNSNNRSGAVYLFTRTGTTWSQQAYVKASNSETDDQFGKSIAISGDGNTMAVGGAYREESNATGINGDQNDNSNFNSGALYIFTRTGTTWTQQTYIKASNAEAGDEFGFSVSLSGDGNTMAVGAWFEDSNATNINGDQNNNSNNRSGAVYVFTRTGTTWTQQAYIKASNSETDDIFGFCILLSSDGNTLAVGGFV
ncbi:probable outer membrane secretion protein -rhodobacter capsulatus [Nonlabens ulvanivorans]|uniref:Probable outer membrane secretion protein-rhodobacter capsulatus n=1 Tax=Nonlabens ulvanivorans TaxID=906888 RepID=A0A081D744_NONUL|nr:FG-GAP repeat protein [Nonlabens ulvanivorans]GAK74740.1 probable outer membrane secretion protein -rhodobacter capsulatus [Nonlabens ulvanivorans]